MGMDREDINKLNELAQSVLKISRNTLVINLRFMDTAISRLSWVSLPEAAAVDPELKRLEGTILSTEGTVILYDPLSLCKMYAQEKENGARAYLHLVLHCVFRHFLVSPTINRELWNLACDMAVEGVINGLGLNAVTSSYAARENTELQNIAKHVNNLLTAEKIYNYLQSANVSEQQLEKLSRLFALDAHDLWYADPEEASAVRSAANGVPNQGGNKPDQSNNKQKENNQDDDEQSEGGGSNQGNQPEDEPSGNESPDAMGPSQRELEQDWRDISEHMQMDMETFSKQQGDQAGGMMQNLREVNREKYDYTSFLKKFAVMGEAMKVNDDEFDYIFYTYGMRLFPERRMPLIEPLEYKEVKRIREFVIAIDTSGSVMGNEVQFFLQKTYNILKSTDSFFSKINLHIIQCDADIQEDVKITNQEEFDRYLANMKLKGFGGTDFRPVFHRVDEMIHNREFQNLKGLLYFTDGYGTFPERMPAYKTAFVFVQDGYAIPEVPVWAMKLVLQKEDLGEKK